MARRRGKRGKLIIALGVIVGAAALFWWSLGSEQEISDAPRQTTKVIRRDFASTVLATGAVKPQVGAEVKVGARISGKVEHLRANIGDRVKKGQVLAELEKEDLDAVVSQRRAELQVAQARLSAVKTLRPREIDKAKADLARWQAALVLARKELSRQNELLRDDFTSQQAQDEAQESLTSSQAQVDAAQKGLELAEKRLSEDLKQAEAEIRRARAALDNAIVKRSYATIRAPISGVIAGVATQQGETVSAGLNAPTFVTIIDLKRLQVDAYVDEVDIGKVAVGQECTFTVDAFPAREFSGRVSAIYPKAVIQENVVNYDVVVDILDPYDGLLRPEMTASVTIALKRRIQVLAVPAAAVRRQRGKTVVYVQGADGPKPREVKLGWRDGQWLEVASGLREDETILLTEQMRRK